MTGPYENPCPAATTEPSANAPPSRPGANYRPRKSALTLVDVPGAVFGTAVSDINNAGAVVGVYGNPDAAAGPPSASTTPDMPPKLPPRQAGPAASR